MNAIQIRTRICSSTPHLPKLKALIGKTVKIADCETEPPKRATHDDWEAFF